MSLLNQLFNRGLLGAKCKTCLVLVISRIKLLQNKRQLQLNQMRKEISQFLQTGQEVIARIRVEHVIREQNMQAAYEILEIFCEFVLARLPILESQRECPRELQEAIASMIFAAPRCSDLPDLSQVRNLFTAKYGKEFTSAASELLPDTSVNRDIIEKLSVKPPSSQAKLSLLKEIAQEYNLKWDPLSTKAEFSKKHEDLLGGSNKISNSAVDSWAFTTGNVHDLSLSNDTHPIITKDRNQGTPCVKAPTLAISNVSVADPDKTELLVTSHSEGSVGDVKTMMSSNSSDVMERARAAIASAERASAAARRAAELVNVKCGPWIQKG